MNSRLLILGATGGIGRCLIDQASARGHQVTAFARSPEKLRDVPRGVAVVRGDPLSAGELRQVLPEHDAVLSSLGPSGLGRTTVLRDGARGVVEAMEATGRRRLLIVSAALLFDDGGVLVPLLRSTLLRNVYEGAMAMESVVRASGLEWTIVRPPRLTNGPLTRSYAAEDGKMPRGSVVVSRADVADFLLDAAEHNEHVREIVGIARS
jgi:putative NADH-flavin reductase